MAETKDKIKQAACGEWTYVDKLMVDPDFSVEKDGFEQSIILSYGEATPGNYYINFTDAEPIDKYGSDFKPVEVCHVLNKQQLQELIDKLQQFVRIDENPAIPVLFANKK